MKLTSFLKKFRNSRLFWPLVAWALILIFNAIVAPSFFRLGIIEDPVYGKRLYGNLIDIFNNGAPLMLVAIGMTLVIATGGVDLSVGAVIAISAAMGAVLINPALGNQLITNEILTRNATNTPLPLIILADLAAGTLCGLWNGLLVAKAKIQPMVATLILMVAGRGIAQLITNGQIMTIYYTPISGLETAISWACRSRFTSWGSSCSWRGSWCARPPSVCSSNRWESMPNRLFIAASMNKTSSC